MRWFRTLAIVFVLSIFGSLMPASSGISAAPLFQEDNCSGVDGYITALQEEAGDAIEQKNTAYLEAFGDAEIAVGDLSGLARSMAELSVALGEVDAPFIAERFHDSYIAYLEAMAEVLNIDDSDPDAPYVFMIFSMTFGMQDADPAYEQMDEAAAALIVTCPEFESAFNLLEPALPVSIDASPAALPIINTADCAEIDDYLIALQSEVRDEVLAVSIAVAGLFEDEVLTDELAVAAAAVEEGLATIDPPEFAQAYHRAQRALMSAYVEIVEAGVARNDPTMYRVAYGLQVDPKVQAALRTIRIQGDHISTSCPAFSEVQSILALY